MCQFLWQEPPKALSHEMEREKIHYAFRKFLTHEDEIRNCAHMQTHFVSLIQEAGLLRNNSKLY